MTCWRELNFDYKGLPQSVTQLAGRVWRGGVRLKLASDLQLESCKLNTYLNPGSIAISSLLEKNVDIAFIADFFRIPFDDLIACSPGMALFVLAPDCYKSENT